MKKLIFAIVFLFLAASSQAKIIFVDADATGPTHDGSSWITAFKYLQDALAAATYGDELQIAQGVYMPDQGMGIVPGDREATFQLKNGVVIKGGYAGFDEPDPNARDINLYETTLSGDIGMRGDTSDNCYHVVTGSGTDKTAVLDGFAITGGNANDRDPHDQGGGMFNQWGNPTLANCTLIGNSAKRAGGMYNERSSPTLTNCMFSGNSADHYSGGGMFNYEGSYAELLNCTFIGNLAGSKGGAIYNWDSSPILTNCTFSGNTAGMYGGVMAIYYGIRPKLTNCTFTGNSAGKYGGGMWIKVTSLTLNNCTFAANSASKGNSLACDSPLQQYPSDVQIANCILWDGGDEIWNNDESTIAITYSDVESGWPGEGNIEADPCFVDLGYWDADGVWVDGDYHLLPDSPCIDSGNPNYTAEPNEMDLDGKPRVLDGNEDGISVVDMGAYEYKPSIPAEARIVPRTINLASKGQWITCYIWLPEGYNIADIDGHSLFLEGQIQPLQFWPDEQKQVATARFSREKVQAILNIGQVELTITGQLMEGTLFEGTDLITVIDKRGGKSAK